MARAPKELPDCFWMYLGSFNSWINYTIYYNATKKKPLKSSVSKGICVSSSRLWHTVTAASLGCVGDHLPKAEFSCSPLVTVKATECQHCQLHMLLHSCSFFFFVWVVISELCYCISSHWISLFPPKVEKRSFLTIQLGTLNPQISELIRLVRRLQWLVALWC